jgi:hypothetical protein
MRLQFCNFSAAKGPCLQTSSMDVDGLQIVLLRIKQSIAQFKVSVQNALRGEE